MIVAIVALLLPAGETAATDRSCRQEHGDEISALQIGRQKVDSTVASAGAGFQVCTVTNGYGADYSSSCCKEVDGKCVPQAAGLQPRPPAGCQPDKGWTALCPDPWNNNTATWGCEIGAPTPGFVKLTKVCGPGTNTTWVWNNHSMSCLLRGMNNGADYNLEDAGGESSCTSSTLPKDMTRQQFKAMKLSWLNMALNHSKPLTVDQGRTAHIVKVDLGKFWPNNETVEAAAAIGHGVLNGVCGQCFVVKTRPDIWNTSKPRYAVVLQVDVRAWSLEISKGAAGYMGPQGSQCWNNEACCIPEVMPISCEDVMTLNKPKA